MNIITENIEVFNNLQEFFKTKRYNELYCCDFEIIDNIINDALLKSFTNGLIYERHITNTFTVYNFMDSSFKYLGCIIFYDGDN